MGVVVSIKDRHGARGLQPLIDLVKGDMERVNRLILAMAGSDVELIPVIANHLIESGGKRLRPMLTIASAAMFGDDADGKIKLAASVEFMHTATLLHDDVVDDSDMRRGKPAARKLWGNQATVLVGDFLLGQAFRRMVEVGSLDALAVLSDAAAIIAEGEVWQLAASKNVATTEDDYMAVIKAKTAALFAAACEVGPILAGCGEVERAALKSYGMNLGLAFQLVDDALDYGGSSSDLGKSVGDDFREGKITLPVILAYRRGGEADRAFWARCLNEGETGEAALTSALERIQSTNALADTVDRARHFGAIAHDALAPMPDSEHKRALLDVVDFCIERVS